MIKFQSWRVAAFHGENYHSLCARRSNAICRRTRAKRAHSARRTLDTMIPVSGCLSSAAVQSVDGILTDLSPPTSARRANDFHSQFLFGHIPLFVCWNERGSGHGSVECFFEVKLFVSNHRKGAKRFSKMAYTRLPDLFSLVICALVT